MLHIIQQSPSHSESLNNCLHVIQKTDDLLLIENGVFCALSNHKLRNHPNIFILTPHAKECGVLEQLISHIQQIDFDGFVELVAKHAHIVRW